MFIIDRRGPKNVPKTDFITKNKINYRFSRTCDNLELNIIIIKFLAANMYNFTMASHKEI